MVIIVISVVSFSLHVLNTVRFLSESDLGEQKWIATSPVWLGQMFVSQRPSKKEILPSDFSSILNWITS